MRFEQSYQLGKSILTIKLGDISQATTEVIVTSDDQQLSMGGGTSLAIRKAAGESVYEATRALVPVPLGGVVPTPSGNLAAHGVRYIFHAATIPSSSAPSVENQGEIVASATEQAINLLRVMKLKSIAFPALGTGFARFDPQPVAIAMSQVLRKLMTASPDALQVEIRLLMGVKRDDEAVAFFAEFTKQAMLGPYAVRSHGVVLIHGIRTAAGWRERIGNEIEAADSSLTPLPVGYEFFDVVRFWVPGPWRRAAADTVWMKMNSVFDNPNINHVSVIAHSFGTWIVGHLLVNRGVRFHRVILCGAILDTKFDWNKVKQQIDSPNFENDPNAYVVNDCGTRDVWPIFAKFATWGYGVSGRWGFQHSLVRDRFHEIAHSGFFKDGFATKHWVPALSTTKLSKGIDHDDKISPRTLETLLTILKLPYLVVVAAIVVWWLYWRA